MFRQINFVLLLLHSDTGLGKSSLFKRIKDDNFGFAVICCLVIVRRSIIGVVDVGLAGIHYDTDMAQLDRTLLDCGMPFKLCVFNGYDVTVYRATLFMDFKV